jgi:hypothetical protein
VKMDKDPDMAGCEDWMKDALGLTDEVIGMGEGDLLELGDFHQVEYMVRFLSACYSRALPRSLTK